MRKVLLIDDSKTVLAAISQRLSFMGMEPVVPNSLTHIASLADKVDAIVMGIEMPSIDGITLAGKIRGWGFTTPIVFYSSSGARSTEVSNSLYVEKSSDPNDLCSFIHALLKKETHL